MVSGHLNFALNREGVNAEQGNVGSFRDCKESLSLIVSHETRQARDCDRLGVVANRALRKTVAGTGQTRCANDVGDRA